MVKTKKDSIGFDSLPRFKIKLDGSTTITIKGYIGFETESPLRIQPIGTDSEGYVIYEISTVTKEQTANKVAEDHQSQLPIVEVLEDEHLGTERSRSVGRAKDFGVYDYYRRPTGHMYVVIDGKKPHKLELGSLTDRDSPLSIVAKTIAFKFERTQFARRQLIPIIDTKFTYSQKLKAILDTMYILGFLERELKASSTKRPKELYRATDALRKYIIPSANPEQT